MDRDGLIRAVNATFYECPAFFRDTTLPDLVRRQYRPGVLLREPTFCDATLHQGGFVAPHRYVIFSSNARSLRGLSPDGWGLCAWPRGRLLKVIDYIESDGRTQITLLEIPEHLVFAFLGAEPNRIEVAFAGHGRQLFRELRDAPPVPELDTDEWRDRLTYPIGINDAGNFFPLYGPEHFASAELRETAAEASAYQARRLLDAGLPQDADICLRTALDGLRDVASQLPVAYASLLINRSDLRVEIADYRQAEADLHAAFRLCVDLPGDRLHVAAISLRLGHLYRHTGDDFAAEQFYQHALKLRRRASGAATDPGLMPVLMSLGVLHEQTGRFASAGEYLDEALTIAQTHGMAELPALLNNVARLQQARGQFAEALSTCQAALAANAASGYGGVEHRALLGNVAELHAANGNDDEAHRLFGEVLRAEHELVEQVNAFGSEQQRLGALRAARSRGNQYISLLLSRFAGSSSHMRELADLIVGRKGAGVDAFARERAALRGDDDRRVHDGTRDVRRLRTLIAERRLAGPDRADPQRFHEELRVAQARLNELEAQLAGAAGPDHRREVDCASIARAIPPGTVVVEFERYHRFSFGAVRASGDEPWGPHRYVAVVITAAHGDQPVVLDLGDAADIDALVSSVRADIAARRWPSDAATRLHGLLIAPLWRVAGPAQRLLLAPDGVLCQVPFEVLVGPSGTPLIDECAIGYLTASRDLLWFGESPVAPAGPAVVLAGPDYDTGSAQRTGRPFGPLPGARSEGVEVAQLLGVRPLLDGEATKAAVHSVQSPGILHVATHGFFLEPEKPLSPAEIAEGMTVAMTDPDREAIVLDGILVTPTDFRTSGEEEFGHLRPRHLANPLLRGCLVFTGANTWYNDAGPTSDSGLLTAYEVTSLDLAGTSLVVLSACGTGLGEDQPGEGVFGLRRAFHLAGARSLIMSLWQVPDEPTKLLMSHLYRLLAEGCSPTDALREAQRLTRTVYPRSSRVGRLHLPGRPRMVRIARRVAAAATAVAGVPPAGAVAWHARGGCC